MKTHHCSSNIFVAPQFCRQLKEVIARTKERLRAKYEELFPESGSHLDQALDEAENLAWETPFPHLFLPDFVEARLNALTAQPAFAVAA